LAYQGVSGGCCLLTNLLKNKNFSFLFVAFDFPDYADFA